LQAKQVTQEERILASDEAPHLGGGALLVVVHVGAARQAVPTEVAAGFDEHELVLLS